MIKSKYLFLILTFLMSFNVSYALGEITFLDNFESSTYLNSPRYLQTFTIGDDMFAIVSGRDGDEISTFNLSNPLDIQFLDNYVSSSYIDGPIGFDVYVQDNYTYAIVVGVYGDEISTFNLSNPLDIQFLDNYVSSSYIDGPTHASVFFIGDDVYALVSSSDDDEITTFDITNPKDISRVSSYTSSTTLNVPREVHTFYVGDYVYGAVIGRGGNEISTFNLSNNGMITFLDNYASSSYISYPLEFHIFNVDEYVYAIVSGRDGNEISTFNLSNPLDIQFLDNYASSDYINGPRGIDTLSTKRGIYAIVSGEYGDEISTFNVTDPSNIQLLHNYEGVDNPLPVDIFTIGKDVYAITTEYIIDEISTFQLNFTINYIETNIQDYYNEDEIVMNIEGVDLNVINVTLNYTGNPTEIIYNLNDLGNVSLGVVTDSTNFLLGLNDDLTSSIVEGENRVVFYYENESKETVFILDTKIPEIDLTVDEFESYEVNVSQYLRIDNLTLQEFKGDVVVTEGNVTLDLQNYTFESNGNKTLQVNVTDKAGNNEVEEYVVLVNPLITVSFFNSTNEAITDFKVNDKNYSNNFTFNVYDYGLKVQNFTFTRKDYDEFNFSINLTNTTNTTFNYTVGKAEITILVKDIGTGVLVENDNFDFFVTQDGTTNIKNYEIKNSNTVTFKNDFEVDTTLIMSLVDEENNVLQSIKVISPFKDINISFYIAKDKELTLKNVKILDPSLIAIKKHNVKLYVNILATSEFVLVQEKETNTIGIVSFPIVIGDYVYTICSTYEDETKCLNQIVFDSITEDYEIAHTSTFNGVTQNVLGDLKWSLALDRDENENTTQATFVYEDTALNVDKFCLEAYSLTDENSTLIEEVCGDSLNGMIVRTYSLENRDSIEVKTYYYYQDKKYLLNVEVERNVSSQLENFVENGLLLFFFILLFSLMSGYLLETFKNFDAYVVGTKTVLLLFLAFQSYITLELFPILLWSILAIKDGVAIATRGD